MTVTRHELRFYIRAMFQAKPNSVAARQAWLLDRSTKLDTSAQSNLLGKQLQSQSSSGFSATFATQNSGDSQQKMMKLLDRLYPYAEYDTLQEALDAVPPPVTSWRGDSRKMRL